MASPGRSWIVLFWMGRKLIVLLQLLPFSSPHRGRPALVLMASPNPGMGLTPSCVGLEDVDQFGDSWCLHESRKVRTARHFRANSEQSPCCSNEETEILKDFNDSFRALKPGIFLRGTKIQAFWLLIPPYLFTTCVCTWVGSNIFNADRCL